MTVVTLAFQKKKLAIVLVLLSKRACDEKDFTTAARILHIIEDFVIKSSISSKEKRLIITSLVEGYELLWTQRNDKLQKK